MEDTRKLRYKDLRTLELIECDIRKSLFILRSSGVINSTSLKCGKPIITETDINVSFMDNFLFVNAYLTNVQFNLRRSGFITLGVERRENIMWNRKWCVLDRHQLQFWNYPNDEVYKMPLNVINLKNAHCVSLASREICTKRRTLVMKTFHPKMTYYFHVDSRSELREWHDDLNNLIDNLRGWKMYMF